ncbi:substrate-binding domain-containing protein [Streptomyces sp. Ru72]|uniref:substrate-binding domain-containing protein n=1 Tax=Streptomyces sp. Ru72 TaxID=2080747 RepID=UPI0021565EEC|nr:substrate-binding domain-containing protein [Streptomyces sp. Ru72]
MPHDVAVAGHDDITTTLDMYPALTTVHVPHEELGRAAVRLALHAGEFAESRHQVLGAQVVVQDSTRTSGR